VIPDKLSFMSLTIQNPASAADAYYVNREFKKGLWKGSNR